MASICFYFQVHQPYRLRHYSIFDSDHNYFDDHKNKEICRKVAKKCYLPTNRLMLELINRFDGKFKISYSLTGVFLEQVKQYCPEVLDSFVQLAKTGCVEFLGETYYHSLSFLFSKDEFKEQVRIHSETIKNLFGQQPKVFRNTELIYNNHLPEVIDEMGGFNAILAEGADHILGYRNSNFVYRPVTSQKLRLLMKNYKLSDDIAFRFSNRGWNEWPLTAEKYTKWVNDVNGCGYVVNLFMDYETFGEHQWESTGIFDFMRHLPGELLKHPDNNFMTPSEAAAAYPVSDAVDVPWTISWADIERDLSAWRGNPMQENSLEELYKLEQQVKQTGDLGIIGDWRKMQTSDHFYYMCTKYFSDGDVHKYFNPYDSPYESYINFMNSLDNLRARCVNYAAAAESQKAVPQPIEQIQPPQRRRVPRKAYKDKYSDNLFFTKGN